MAYIKVAQERYACDGEEHSQSNEFAGRVVFLVEGKNTDPFNE